MQGITCLFNKNTFFDIAKGSAASLALFIAYILLMFAGPLTGIFAPFPVLYYTLKSGRGVGAAIILIATLVLFGISPAGALIYLLQCGLFSVLLAEFLARGNGAAKSIAWTVAINVLVIVVFAVSYALWQGVDLNGLILKGINNSLIQTETYYKNSGLGSDELEVLRIGLRQAADFVGKAYPSLLVVCIGAFAGLNLLLLKKSIHRLPRQLSLGDFCRFKNPDKLIWVLIVSGFALLTRNDLVTRTALNILIVLISLYFVQGLAIAAHFFKRFQVPRFITYLFYALLIVQPYLTAVVAAVGLFDLWCDFRAPKKQENL
jgi:uncharacterized protein YybS (DUF2232 family)